MSELGTRAAADALTVVHEPPGQGGSGRAPENKTAWLRSPSRTPRVLEPVPWLSIAWALLTVVYGGVAIVLCLLIVYPVAYFTARFAGK